MLILFGWRHYTRTHISPSALTFAVPPHYREFQLRQYYFHICFLPVFPLDTYWVGLTPEKKLFKVDDDLQEKLWEHRDPGTPFITMLVPLAALAALLIFLISAVWQNETRQPVRGNTAQETVQPSTSAGGAHSTNALPRKVNKQYAPVHHPSLDDYYSFRPGRKGDRRKFLLAKVTGISDSALQLTPAKKMSELSYNATELIGLFEDTFNTGNPVWIKRSLLVKMADESVYPRREDSSFFNRGALYLEEIRHLVDSPEFQISGGLAEVDGTALFELRRNNEGIYLWLKSITEEKGHIIPHREESVNNDETGFDIYSFDADFRKSDIVRFKLELRDISSRTYIYRVEITRWGDSTRIIPLRMPSKKRPGIVVQKV